MLLSFVPHTKGRCHQSGCSRSCSDPDVCGGPHGLLYTALIMADPLLATTMDLITSECDISADDLNKERGDTYLSCCNLRGPILPLSKGADGKQCEGCCQCTTFGHDDADPETLPDFVATLHPLRWPPPPKQLR